MQPFGADPTGADSLYSSYTSYNNWAAKAAVTPVAAASTFAKGFAWGLSAASFPAAATTTTTAATSPTSTPSSASSSGKASQLYGPLSYSMYDGGSPADGLPSLARFNHRSRSGSDHAEEDMKQDGVTTAPSILPDNPDSNSSPKRESISPNPPPPPPYQ